MADKREFEIDGKLLSSLRVVDLKQELEKRGLSKSGSKKDLVDRLKMQLKLERLHESASTDEGHVPNLKLQDEIAEPNDLIKEYLAKQQKIYEIQKEVRRRVELEEQQVRESSEASAGDTSQEEEELEQIRLRGEREKQQKFSVSVGETSSFCARNIIQDQKEEREVYDDDAAVDLTGSSNSYKESHFETQRESSKDSSDVTAQSIEETKEAIRALSRDSGNEASPSLFASEIHSEDVEAASEQDSNMAEDLSIKVNVRKEKVVMEDPVDDVKSEKETEEETLKIQPEEDEKMEGIEEELERLHPKKKEELPEPEQIKIVKKDGDRGRREQIQPVAVEQETTKQSEVVVLKADDELAPSPARRGRPRLKRMQGNSTPAQKEKMDEEEEELPSPSVTEDSKEPEAEGSISSRLSPLFLETSLSLVDEEASIDDEGDQKSETLSHTTSLRRENLDKDGKNMRDEEVGSSSSNEQENAGVSSRNSSRSSARERNGRKPRRRSSASSSRSSSGGSSRSRSKSSSSSSGSSSGSRSPSSLRRRTGKTAVDYLREESMAIKEDSTSRASPRHDTITKDDANTVAMEVEEGTNLDHSATSPNDLKEAKEEAVSAESETKQKILSLIRFTERGVSVSCLQTDDVKYAYEQIQEISQPAVVGEVHTRITTRKISISSSKERREENGEGNAEKQPRRRKWGGGSGATTSTVKRPSFSISTDSLKGLIPDVHVKTPVTPLETIEDVSFREDSAVPPKKSGIENDSGTANSAKREAIVWSTPQDESKSEKLLQDDVKGKALAQLNTTRRLSATAPRKQSPSSSVRRSPSPARNPPGCIIHIRNLVRPFTLNQLKELLSQTGTLVDNGFWIDKIKSKCYVTYLNEEDAVLTRHALHGIHWPSSNPKMLVVDYATRDELEFHRNLCDPLEGPKVVQVGNVEDKNSGKLSRSNEVTTAPQNAKDRRRTGKEESEPEVKVAKRERRSSDRSNNLSRHQQLPIREWDRDKIGEKSPGERARATRVGGRRGRSSLSRSRSRGRSPHVGVDDRAKGVKDRDRHAKGDLRDRRDRRERRREEEEAPAKLLDDLFRKTKTTPCIYWLPLTTDQIRAKEDERKQRQVEREKRRQLETTDKDRSVVGGIEATDPKKIRDRDESRNRRRSHSPSRSRNRRR